MTSVEKTVFISYRRANAPWALAIFQNLTSHDYDVFLDYDGIASGDFESVIIENIKARAHFLVILTLSALDRCREPGDWLRREIEEAMECRRNIVPLMLEGFDFGKFEIKSQLTGRLAALSSYNGLIVTPEYFDAAMKKLRDNFLDVPIDAVLHPVSATAREGAKAQQVSAATASPLTDATTAFIGETAQGPVQPILLTCWDDFQLLYGPPLDTSQSFIGAALRGFFDNGGELAYVVRVVAPNATAAMLSVPTEDGGQQLVFRARSVGFAGNGLRVQIQPGSRRGIHITISNDLSADFLPEDYDNLSPSEEGPNPLLVRINEHSKKVMVDWANPKQLPAAPISGNWVLTGGADGCVTVAEYIGSVSDGTRLATGLEAMDGLSDVSLICLPDAVHPRFSPAEQSELTQWLTARAERDNCIALLALPLDEASDPCAEAPTESSFAAAFTPWLPVAALPDGPWAAVPPVGHVAGTLARHDRMRGAHVSPIGFEVRGTFNLNALGVQPVIAGSTDACARRGVNLIVPSRSTPSVLQLGGAVTNAIDDEYRPLEVRRFNNYVSRTLSIGTAWVSYAQSNEATWTRLRSDIEEFFKTLWRNGVLLGETPEEAFFVRCGSDTLTDEDIANGRITIVIGFTLARPELKIPNTLVLQAMPPDGSGEQVAGSPAL